MSLSQDSDQQNTEPLSAYMILALSHREFAPEGLKIQNREVVLAASQYFPNTGFLSGLASKGVAEQHAHLLAGPGGEHVNCECGCVHRFVWAMRSVISGSGF